MDIKELIFTMNGIAMGLVDAARYEGRNIIASGSPARFKDQLIQPIYVTEGEMNTPYAVVYDYPANLFFIALRSGHTSPLRENSIARFLKEIRREPTIGIN